MAGYLGLSIGARNLVAAPDDGAVTTRRAVLTLYPHRPAELGLPAENTRLGEPGVVISGFVERVGDPVPIVAADRSAHSGAGLVAEALAALIRTVGPAPCAVGVAVPAHWRRGDVDALRRHLPPLLVVSDAEAALTALQVHPGLPARGVVVLCDLGATGTSITLADAGAGFRPIGDTVRVEDFSGDLVDQAVLRHVLAGLDVDPCATSAVAALTQLRDRCRTAKERLSVETATAVSTAGSTVRMTRSELEELLRDPVDGFVAAVEESLRRSNIRGVDVAAVATVGGGARIPFVTQRLSAALRIPVVTTPRVQVVSAVGAGLIALRGLDDVAATVLGAAAPLTIAAPAAPTMAAVPLAWSAGDSSPDVADYSGDPDGDARPELLFRQAESAAEPLRWYRRPGVVFAAAACLAVTAAAGLVVSTGEDPVGTTPAGSTDSRTVVAVPEAPVASGVTAPPAQPVGPAPVAEVVLTRSPDVPPQQAQISPPRVGPAPVNAAAPPPSVGPVPVSATAPAPPTALVLPPAPPPSLPPIFPPWLPPILPPAPGPAPAPNDGAPTNPGTGTGDGEGTGAGHSGTGGEEPGGAAGSGTDTGGDQGTEGSTGAGGDTGNGGGVDIGVGTGSGEGIGTGQVTGSGEDTGSGGGTGGDAGSQTGGDTGSGDGAASGGGTEPTEGAGTGQDAQAGSGEAQPLPGGDGDACGTAPCP